MLYPLLLLYACTVSGVIVEEDDPGTGSDTESSRYHPEGWSDSEVHGLAAKLQEQECVDCHGETLEGDVGVSCDSCHPTGWRTDCTFCHGGDVTDEGAPPRDMDGSSTDLSFDPHTAHVTENIGPGFDCTACHDKPTDVLSEGHLFIGDDSPAVAEVDFSESLADEASWSGSGCSNNYCHGNGQDNGSVDLEDGPMDCGSCHAGAESSESAISRMSGRHHTHVWDERIDCSDCHGETTDDDRTIADTSLHINGQVDIALHDGIEYSDGRCTGSCHRENHENRRWE